jgi:hypothetical protein
MCPRSLTSKVQEGGTLCHTARPRTSLEVGARRRLEAWQLLVVGEGEASPHAIAFEGVR